MRFLQLSAGVLIASVVVLLLVGSAARVRSSLYYRYSQIYVGMPAEEASALFKREELEGWAGSMGVCSTTYSTQEGRVSITTSYQGLDQRIVISKCFTPSDESHAFVRWLVDLGL